MPKTTDPQEQENDQHGGAAPSKPRFGPTDRPSGGDDSPIVSQRRANDLQDLVHGPGPEAKSASRGEIANKEANPAEPSKGGSAAEKEKGALDKPATGGKLGKGFTGGAADAAAPAPIKAAKMLGRLIGGKKGFTKKKGATGGILGIVVGVLIFLFSIGSGPLKLIHLSELLQKNFFGTEQTMKLRMKGAFRFYKTGDVGQTRVGKLGSVVFKKTVTKLEGIGYDFSDRNKITGHVKSVTIDTSKHPGFKNLPDNQRQAAIIKHLDIEDPSIVSKNGAKIKVNLDATTVKGMDFTKATIGTAVGDLRNGTIMAGMGLRVMKKFYNLPRLFSPLEKRAKAAGNRFATKAERKKAETERSKAINEESARGGADAREKVRNKISGKQVALGIGASALVATEGLCIIRDIADSVVAVNRSSVVIPSVAQAVDKTATGAQAKSGNLTTNAAGQVAESFVDENGKDIFAAKGMQVLAGKTDPRGEDLPYDYKQAFSNNTTAAKIKGSVGSPKFFGVDLGGVACSTGGQIVQGAVSLAFVAGAIITALPSGGASVGAVVAKTSASAAAAAGAYYLIKKGFTKLLSSDAIVPAVFNGPLGGNLLAYGGREASNVGARALGGTALSASASAALDREAEEQNKLEFQSKSFASRLFDVYDQRSLASGIIDNTSSSPGTNITNLANSLGSLSSMGSRLFSAFMPKAFAANEPYDWGFPRYGVPKDLIENSKYENPYDNAEKAAVLLEGGGGEDYRERAKKCFGVDINKDSGVWTATAQEEVNPNSSEYSEGDCDDTSENWKRIILFVLDTRLLTTVACYEEDEQACAELGAGGSGASSGQAVSGKGGAKIAAVAMREFDKNGNKALETCGENCGPEVQKYTGGPSGPAAPWCAWFVSWVYREAGYEFKGAPAGSDGNIPAVANMVTWFKQNGIHFTPSSSKYKPEPGDAVMYGGSTHMGIVVKVDGDNIETVEGNTSGDGSFNANGETIGKKKYNYKNYVSRSIEFGRLKDF